MIVASNSPFEKLNFPQGREALIYWHCHFVNFDIEAGVLSTCVKESKSISSGGLYQHMLTRTEMMHCIWNEAL